MVECIWKDEAPVLQSRVSCYGRTFQGGARIEFEREMVRLIEEGILRLYEGKEISCVALSGSGPAYQEQG